MFFGLMENGKDNQRMNALRTQICTSTLPKELGNKIMEFFITVRNEAMVINYLKEIPHYKDLLNQVFKSNYYSNFFAEKMIETRGDFITEQNIIDKYNNPAADYRTILKIRKYVQGAGANRCIALPARLDINKEFDGIKWEAPAQNMSVDKSKDPTPELNKFNPNIQ